MAQVPNDTRFIGINPTVNLRERRSARINRETQPVSMQDITDSIRPYKVYTALLTQNGTSSPVNATSGPLIVGVSYNIDIYNAGDDFSNVGGPAAGLQGEWEGYSFLATGTTPNDWNNSSLLIYDEGAPVATVLENTIGNIWFNYNDVGQYTAHSNDLFTIDKTVIDIDAYGQDGNAQGLALIANTTLNPIDKITIYTSKGSQSDGLLQKNRLEIRVYN
jgi:hypothetical protein